MNIKQAKQEIINTVQAYSCGTAASGTFDRTAWNR